MEHNASALRSKHKGAARLHPFTGAAKRRGVCRLRPVPKEMHMASHGDTDYTHGTMDVQDQSATYQGFMTWATWGGILVALTVLLLTLVFAAGAPWLASLFGVAALGIIAGLAMNLGGAFFATVVALSVIGLISGGIATLVANAL
jgi:Bacterial aa3 type cytochrome c oxidase subunit IV